MLATDTKATAVMAASGLNRSVGESALTEAQVLAAVRLLIDLGMDARGADVLPQHSPNVCRDVLVAAASKSGSDVYDAVV